jgi:hypothetical protein
MVGFIVGDGLGGELPIYILTEACETIDQQSPLRPPLNTYDEFSSGVVLTKKEVALATPKNPSDRS